MNVNYNKDGDYLYFYLAGELDQHYAKGVKDYIDRILDDSTGYNNVVFNMGDLKFMDSTGIGIILGRYKRLKKCGVNCFIENPTLNVEKVLELSGIYEVINKIWGKIMNKVFVRFSALSENESFARTLIAGFLLPLNPSLDELSDIKTAVSEAVTNSVVHAYPNTTGDVELSCWYDKNEVHIIVKDYGVGISNIKLALEPFYSTKKNEERSGMGFTVMGSFMDELKVDSNINQGVMVHMVKKLAEIKE